MERKKILFLQKRLLFPTDSGGKIRTLNVLRHLARWHDVTYLCNVLPEEEPFLSEMKSVGLTMVTIPWDEAPRGSLRFYRDLALNVVSPFPFNVNKDFDPRLRRRANELLESHDFDLLVCDFVQMARNCIGLRKVPKLLFEHNVEAQIFQRHTQHGSLARRAYMWLQWKKMHWFEGRAGRDFDSVIAVSDEDKRTYEHEYGWDHVSTIDTAVDTDYFSPPTSEAVPGRCVFIGSMDWLPNEDGVRYFVREVWPLIRQQTPSATFQVVGRNPTPAIRALDGKEGVEVTGSVPDVRPFVASAEVVVIPLLVGGGTRLKVFEAMAMDRPIVSTSLGVEGLEVKHDENVLIADSSEELAACVTQLFQNEALRTKLSKNALELVQERYSSEVVARQFDAICRATI